MNRKKKKNATLSDSYTVDNVRKSNWHFKMRCLHKYIEDAKNVVHACCGTVSSPRTTPVDTVKIQHNVLRFTHNCVNPQSVIGKKPTGSASALGTAQGYPQKGICFWCHSHLFARSIQGRAPGVSPSLTTNHCPRQRNPS